MSGMSEEEEEELVLDSSNLIVNYLPSSLTDEGFAQMFERIGPLEAYKLMRNKAGESLAFGFVHYQDPKHGLQAIEAYNGRQREGKTMKVRMSLRENWQKQRNNVKQLCKRFLFFFFVLFR